MGGATVYLASSSFTDLYLHNGASESRPTYSGSGTPWTSAATSPYRIGMNDATGERFVLTAPPVTPIVSGQPPFALWGRTVGLQYTNRQIIIPVQAYATDAQYLGRLLAEIRRRVNSAVTQTTVALYVTYDGQTTIVRVEGGTLQETSSFWNEENGRYVMRAVLTLTCAPGTGSATALDAAVSYTNAVPGATTNYTGLKGDWTRTVGQSLYVLATGTEMSAATAKVLYLATLAGSADSGSLSSAISTTSTSAVAVTGTASYSPTRSRGTRIRIVCQITTPNSALQLRYQVRLGTSSGAIFATGDWQTPGTSTTIVDLGYIIIPQSVLQVGSVAISVAVQARSSTGGSATGTLARIRVLEYYTFARVTIATTGTSETFSAISLQSGAQTGGFVGAVDAPIALMSGGGATTQLCQVAGNLPRAYEGMSLWLAWTSGGAFSSAATMSVTTTMLPVYETLPEV